MQNTFDQQVNKAFRFSILAFVWSWLWWTPRILATFNVFELSPLWDAVLGAVGAIGPGLSAAMLALRSGGKSSAIEFFKRGWKLNFNLLLILPALAIMPIIGGITTGVLVLTGLENPWEFSLFGYIGVQAAPMIVLLLISAVGEEYGWRGYLQKEMQTTWNPFKTSLLLGLIWGVWQLPLHFVSGTLQSLMPVILIVLQAMALSVLFTWLYNKTGGSLLIAALFHFSMSLCGMIFPVWAGPIAQWVYLLLTILSVFALGMLVGWRKHRPF